MMTHPSNQRTSTEGAATDASHVHREGASALTGTAVVVAASKWAAAAVGAAETTPLQSKQRDGGMPQYDLSSCTL